MLDFIRLLKHRYTTVLDNTRGDTIWQQGLKANLSSLALAEAFLDKGEINRSLPDHPLQIAVVGPTQAGKSTLVNLLLQQSLAGVSPLAGYTVHSQGFYVNTQDQQISWIADYFGDSQQFTISDLPSDRHDCYALAKADPNPNHPLVQCLIWDTPDFDSIHSAAYRDSMLRTVALADIVLLVTSKDKYADQSVWDMMSLLEPMKQPTVICLNKIQAKNQAVVERSLAEKWAASREDSVPPIVSLPYCEDGPSDTALAAEMAELFERLSAAEKTCKRDQHDKALGALLAAHWSQWTLPIKAEQEAAREWVKLLDSAVDDALELYQRDYLDHPQHYETFQKALAQLLRLLEIPGLAPILFRARQIVTWPARKLFKLGKSMHRKNLEQSQETTILEQVQEHFMIRLGDAILTNSEEESQQNAWWAEMSSLLKAENPLLKERYLTALQSYLNEFEPEIEATAQRLYQKLEQQPLTLNSLRATRVTTDAAALAVALHTGGIGMHDFIITPAVLSVTSLLAESALGGYMNRMAAELKQRQFQIVKEKLFEGHLKQALQILPQKMNHSSKFNISNETLSEAEAQLKEPRYGLRYF